MSNVHQAAFDMGLELGTSAAAKISSIKPGDVSRSLGKARAAVGRTIANNVPSSQAYASDQDKAKKFMKGILALTIIVIFSSIFGFIASAMLLNGADTDSQSDHWKSVARGIGGWNIVMFGALLAIGIYVMVDAHKYHTITHTLEQQHAIATAGTKTPVVTPVTRSATANVTAATTPTTVPTNTTTNNPVTPGQAVDVDLFD